MKKVILLVLFILLGSKMFSQNLISNLNKKRVVDYYMFSEGIGRYVLMINLKKPLTKRDKVSKIIFTNPSLITDWDISYVVEHTVVICKITQHKTLQKMKQLNVNVGSKLMEINN
jgi:hypothetical protein